MILFLNEDRAYLNWVTHHPQGYVLDSRRGAKSRQAKLHRATCCEVKGHFDRRTHLTTAGHVKIWGAELAELQTWAEEESISAVLCDHCQPSGENGANCPRHLTKMSAEILDYMIDAAVIHLENDGSPYSLCVGDIAACFSKTPKQLSGALHRLIDDGLAVVEGRLERDGLYGPKVLVLPTPAALRTLEAFRDQSDAELESELQKLREDLGGRPAISKRP